MKTAKSITESQHTRPYTVCWLRRGHVATPDKPRRGPDLRPSKHPEGNLKPYADNGKPQETHPKAEKINKLKPRQETLLRLCCDAKHSSSPPASCRDAGRSGHEQSRL